MQELVRTRESAAISDLDGPVHRSFEWDDEPGALDPGLAARRPLAPDPPAPPTAVDMNRGLEDQDPGMLKPTQDEPSIRLPRRPAARKKRGSLVEIEGVGDLPTTLARCCGPIRPQAEHPSHHRTPMATALAIFRRAHTLGTC